MLNRERVVRAVVTAALVLSASPAFAQQQAPPQRPRQAIGPFVVDLRGIFARHKQEPSVANDLQVVPGNLPTRSFGIAGGIHLYPLHAGRITFGFGGHALFAGGSKALDTTPGSTTGTTTATSTSPTVRRHFRTFAPEVSFNFGHRNGWSYISGGLGRSTLFVDRKDQPDPSPQARKTIHYGAGARWFTHHRLAVSLEIRWYAVSPQTATATSVAQPRTTLMVLSGGVAIR